MITNYRISWRTTNNLNTVSSNEIVASSSTSFTIPNLNPDTRYYITVAAINDAGTGAPVMDEAETAPVTAPDAPIGLRITAGVTTTNSITVSWSTPDDDGGAAILDYEISWSTGGEAVSSSRVSGSETSYQIGSSPEQALKAGTLYQISVSARNIRGQGAPSQSVPERTVVGRPSAPGEITATEVTSNSITVSWVVPAEDGGVSVTNYRVSWGFAVSTGEGEADVIPPTTELVIGQKPSQPLKPNTNYMIEVRAQNSVGLSEASTLSVRTLPGDAVVPRAPDAPSGLTTRTLAATSLTVVWDAPFDGGAMITSYRVSWGLGAASTGVDEENVMPPTTELVIGQGESAALLADTAYTIEVRAMNRAGLGEASTLSVRTQMAEQPPPGRPDAPILLPVGSNAITTDRITVRWSTPDDGGLPILRYIVFWNDRSTPVAMGASDYTITGLVPGAKYRIRIAAENRLGPGDFSNRLDLQTEALPPGIPVALRADLVENNRIRVNWEPPTNGGAPITSYTVSWSGGSISSKKVVSSPATTYLIKGLQERTVYQIMVTAENVAGNGPAGVLNQRTLGRPSSPALMLVADEANSVATNSIAVSWTEPDDDGGTAITNYTVFWSSGSISSGTEIVTSPMMTHLIEGLQERTVYQITVTAENRFGPGTPSNILIQETFGRPSSPINLRLIAEARGDAEYRSELGGSKG